MNRRDFLRTGFAGGALALGPLTSAIIGRDRTVALVIDPQDPLPSAPSVGWAIDHLQTRLARAAFTVRRLTSVEQAAPDDLCIVAAGAESTAGAAAARHAGVTIGRGPERLALFRTPVMGRPSLVALGSDARGLMYALLDVADRVGTGAGAGAFMDPGAAVVEAPANAVRSVMRQFTSETLDTPWLFDRAFWPDYLGMLASERFNRLHLAFGLGYDSLNGVRDSYLLFLYPFLVNVPGYGVRLTGFDAANRTRHLEMLRFISEQTVAHGLDFELGIWMHGYRMPNSPSAKYVVEGLTDDAHAAYCRDALAAVLEACPAISSVGLRIHGESGIAEGSYEFWKTVFDGAPRSGRTVEIDLHAKGIDAQMIEHALDTGMPVNVSPKYWAEHLGMPYHQAAIRDLEMPVAGQVGRGLMTLSEGQRVFTRYGYADLMREDRKYTIRHRVFSGTQRLLLSGDPEGMRAYGRMFQFAGSTGFDWMEPLTCRGRRGTGIEGSRRSGYVDAALEPPSDWQKYAYTYRLWGRLTYNPDTPVEVTRRALAGGESFETALASASRILPVVTTAYLPSAACDAYWPEVYWNQPIAAEPRPNPYGDSPRPRTFQNASPLDPALFSRMAEYADELLTGEASGKYSPVDVAGWLDELAAAASAGASRAGRPGGAPTTPEAPAIRRMIVDIDIQRDLGGFFAAKFRAGVLYAIHEKTNDRRALEQAIDAYRRARGFWASLSERAAGVYAADLSASDKISNRGAWADRLPAIDTDIEQLVAKLPASAASADAAVARAIDAVLTPRARTSASIVHTPPVSFRPGAPVTVDIGIAGPRRVTSARLHYRHVNQAERYAQIEMAAADGRYRGVIPAEYTASPFSLQYFVILHDGPGEAWVYPGFEATRLNLPYVVVRRLT